MRKERRTKREKRKKRDRKRNEQKLKDANSRQVTDEREDASDTRNQQK